LLHLFKQGVDKILLRHSESVYIINSSLKVLFIFAKNLKHIEILTLDAGISEHIAFSVGGYHHSSLGIIFPYFVIHSTFNHNVYKFWLLSVSLNHLALFWETYYLHIFVKSSSNMLVDDVEKSEWTIDHLIQLFELRLKKLADFWERL